MSVKQVEKTPPSVEAPPQSPRAQLFVTKVAETNERILKKIITILHRDRALAPEAFVQKNISWEDPSEIDRRTAILYKCIVADLYVSIQNLGLLEGLIMISIITSKEAAAGQFIKEVCLPFVRELVQDLDSRDPGIIDKATSTDLLPEMVLRLTQAHLNLNSKIS